MEIKRHVKNCLGVLLGGRLIRKQFTYVKDDLENIVFSASEIRSNLGRSQKSVDDWNTVILSNNISKDTLIDQYKKRKIISFILLFTLFISLYFLLLEYRLFSGFAGCVISFFLYMNNALRLYQIRHCELCSWPQYLRALRNAYKEFFPLTLPFDWNVISSNKEEI